MKSESTSKVEARRTSGIAQVDAASLHFLDRFQKLPLRSRDMLELASKSHHLVDTLHELIPRGRDM